MLLGVFEIICLKCLRLFVVVLFYTHRNTTTTENIMLTQNAINALMQMSQDTPYNRAFPLTNKAGGSKANRDAVAELKKGEYIKAYTNTETPDGCVMVKMCKKAKEMLSAMGEVDYRHAGTYAKREGEFTVDTYDSNINEQGDIEVCRVVKHVHQVRPEGPNEEIISTVTVLNSQITSVLKWK
jgi:hypothetical protein